MIADLPCPGQQVLEPVQALPGGDVGSQVSDFIGGHRYLFSELATFFVERVFWHGRRLPADEQRAKLPRMLDAPHSRPLADAQDYFTVRYAEIEGLISAQHHLLHGDRKEEAIADTMAIVWSEYVKLAQAGRDVVALLYRIHQVRGDARAVRPNADKLQPDPRHHVGQVPLPGRLLRQLAAGQR